MKAERRKGPDGEQSARRSRDVTVQGRLSGMSELARVSMMASSSRSFSLVS